MTPETIELPLYGATIHIAVDLPGWAKLRRRNRGLEEYHTDCAPAGATTFSVWVPDGPGIHRPSLWVLVMVEDHDDPLELVATCAHEATHAGLALLEHARHPTRGAGDDEAVAYLIGWLTSEIMRVCGRKWSALGRDSKSEKTAL